MEADWEVEIGGDSPLIDAHWSGWIDLTAFPEQAWQLAESSHLPGLAIALMRLNAPASPVWTAKCDVWSPDVFDPDEFDVSPESAAVARACYVDLLPRVPHTWSDIDSATAWCRRICSRLRAHPLPRCRADLVVRAALLRDQTCTIGITTYLTGCGSTLTDALSSLDSALQIAVETVASEPPPTRPASQLQ